MDNGGSRDYQAIGKDGKIMKAVGVQESKFG